MGSLTKLQRYYLYYTGGFLSFVGMLAVLEKNGMSPRWIGYSFLFFTISMWLGGQSSSRKPLTTGLPSANTTL